MIVMVILVPCLAAGVALVIIAAYMGLSMVFGKKNVPLWETVAKNMGWEKSKIRAKRGKSSVFGVVSLVFAGIGSLVIWSIVFGSLAVIFGVIGWIWDGKKRYAIVGTILGVITIAWGVTQLTMG